MSIPLTKKWKTVFRQISEANVLEGKSSGSEDQKVNKGFLKKIPDSAEAALVLEGKLTGIIIIIMTQGKIDLRNESGRPMKVKVVGEVSEK